MLSLFMSFEKTPVGGGKVTLITIEHGARVLGDFVYPQGGLAAAGVLAIIAAKLKALVHHLGVRLQVPLLCCHIIALVTRKLSL